MLRRNPDILALMAIVFFALALRAPVQVLKPLPRAAVTPIRVQMDVERHCIREQMRAHRDEVRQAIREAHEALAESLPLKRF